jgi:hypothetical protein
MFVVALSEYDQVLYEDDNTNRMVEALNLFEVGKRNTVLKSCFRIMNVIIITFLLLLSKIIVIIQEYY